MSIVQTTLIFVGIPVVATLLVTGLVYAKAADRTPRYRPGGPWQFEPVWYLPHPEHDGPVSSMHANQLEPAGAHAVEAHGAGAHAAGAHAIGAHTPGGRPAITGRVAEPATASGGASGEW
jgi:hypothetical protein